MSRRLKDALICALLAAIFRLILQAFVPHGEPLFEESFIAANNLLIPVFFLYAFLVFFFISLIYFKFITNWPYSGFKKGLIFGSMFGLLWFVYFFEPFEFSSDVLWWERLVYPLFDAPGFVFLGAMLGIKTQEKRYPILLGSKPFLLIVVLLLLTRFIAYAVLPVSNALAMSPYDTVIWLLLAGLVLALFTFYLSDLMTIKKPLMSAVWIALIIGHSLLLFNLFIAVVFKVTWLDVLDIILRTLTDTSVVFFGVYMIAKFKATFEE